MARRNPFLRRQVAEHRGLLGIVSAHGTTILRRLCFSGQEYSANRFSAICWYYYEQWENRKALICLGMTEC
jgi:hypothetical protein